MITQKKSIKEMTDDELAAEAQARIERIWDEVFKR